MRLLFYLGHPAHFHLFKNTIRYFKGKGDEVFVLIKKKDILEDLLESEGMPYINIFPKTRGASKFEMARTILKRNFRLFNYCVKNKPDLLVGTSVENSHIGKLLRIPSINVNEDDHDVVPLYSQVSYPLANTILSPVSCKTGKWEHKTIHYQGYHELAYLHPENFTPSLEIAKKYINIERPVFMIRFARLNAHHDKGIRGIDRKLAYRIVEKLKSYGNVYISFEKGLHSELEKYRICIDPTDIHHVMAFTDLYIGDSQTMAAEAGVLGTPFIRYNDFVGRIGYLNELEDHYRLGFGISPSDPGKLFSTMNYLLSLPYAREIFNKRRKRMLSEKIDVNQFLIWFIENFPESKSIMRHDSSFQYKFTTRYTENTLKDRKKSLSKIHTISGTVRMNQS